MGNIDRYNWKEIWILCSKILARYSVEGKVPISNASDLYRRLSKTWKEEYPDEQLPKEVTFRSKLRKKLKLKENERICKSDLYRMFEIYDHVAIPALAKHLKLSPTDSLDKTCYLFIEISNARKEEFHKHRKFLHSVSTKLKKKFPTKILFISYDDDTIVILCPNTNARDSLSRYLDKINVEGADPNAG